MFFRHLRLLQFRNYPALDLRFGPGIHCLTGNNGEGKTNVLEALHYLALTRGWQSQSEKYALREGETFFMTEGELDTGTGSLRVQCNYIAPKGKKMLVDGDTITRLSDHIGRIPLLSILPSDTELIHGPPAVRRRFLDVFISQYDPDYLQALIRYDKALEQRNALLSRWLEMRYWDPEQLLPWDTTLMAAGQTIWQGRADFLRDFEPHFQDYFHGIVSDRERPSLALDSLIVTNTAAEWENLLAVHRDRDRYAGRTGAGIHRDDLTLLIDGNPVKNYGSQGQQKTFVIALRLAQYALLAGRKTQPPVLLLDDIFDKLDMQRMRAIARVLDTAVQGQVFVTDTSPERCRAVFAEVHTRPVHYYQVAGNAVTPLEENTHGSQEKK